MECSKANGEHCVEQRSEAGTHVPGSDFSGVSGCQFRTFFRKKQPQPGLKKQEPNSQHQSCDNSNEKILISR